MCCISCCINYQNKRKVTDIDGTVYIGDAGAVTDEGERSDMEKQEDGITVNVDGKRIEFYQSEVLDIEVIVE